MTEGTKSWLFGCHSIIHSFLVIKAWKHLYKAYPCFWQIVCIFIHDVGYWGKNYLSDKSNEGHAYLGANIGEAMFGEKAWIFLIGHSRSASRQQMTPLSELEAPDDYSWLLAPDWWLRFNQWVEPQLNGLEWKAAVKANWEAGGLDNRKAGFDLAKEMLEKDNDAKGINDSLI